MAHVRLLRLQFISSTRRILSTVFCLVYSFPSEKRRALGIAWSAFCILSRGTNLYFLHTNNTISSTCACNNKGRIQLRMVPISPTWLALLSLFSYDRTKHNSFSGFWLEAAQWGCPYLWQNDCIVRYSKTSTSRHTVANQQEYRILSIIFEDCNAFFKARSAL